MTETVDEARLREIVALAEKATPGPWYEAGLPWFQNGYGVLAGSPDPHAGYLIVDTEVFEGDRGEYCENNPKGVQLAGPDADASYLAACDPQTITSMATELLDLRASLKAVETERDEARETIREMQLFARDKPVDDALRAFAIKFGVAAVMNHEPKVDNLVDEIQRDALDTFCLLARPYLNRAHAAEARASEAERQLKEAHDALTAIATYDPGRSDFSAPSMIASFSQERARAALSRNSVEGTRDSVIEADLCSDCPPAGYADTARCQPCPRRALHSQGERKNG